MNNFSWNTTKEASTAATNKFDDVLSMFDSADAETSAGAIPPGKYRARLVDGVLDRARTGNPCYAVKWELTDGEFQGRHLISRHWMTPKSISRTKGDLLALDIGGEHLRGACPLPDVTAEISVVNRADDAGDLYQEIRRIRKIDDVTSVNGAQAANAGGAMSIHTPEADTADTAGETLDGESGDDTAAALDDESYLDKEFIDFGGKGS